MMSQQKRDMVQKTEITMRKNIISTALILSSLCGANAFAPSKITSPLNILSRNTVQPKSSSFALLASTQQPDATRPLTGNQSYGEQSRKYRRTVYTSDDWVKHRDPDRFFRNLKSIFESGIIVQLVNEVAAVTAVAMLADVWNCALVDGYMDLAG